MQVIDKTVSLDLNDVDKENILVTFSRQAKKEGWSQKEIDVVIDEAKSGDEKHLLNTIWDHVDVNEPDDDDEEEEDEDEDDWFDDDEDDDDEDEDDYDDDDEDEDDI